MKGSLWVLAVFGLLGRVTGLEPFSAGLAMGGGMVLSALWSSRDLVLCRCVSAVQKWDGRF